MCTKNPKQIITVPADVPASNDAASSANTGQIAVD